MKMQFNLVINGADSMEAKFQKCFQENPNLTMDLVRSFGQIVMMAFRLDQSDNVTVEGFRAGKIDDSVKPSEEDNKKVEN